MNDLLINNSNSSDYARDGWELRTSETDPITVELVDGATELHATKWWLKLSAPADGTPQQSFREERGRQRYVIGATGELAIILNMNEEHSARDAELWRASNEHRVKVYAPGAWKSVSGGHQHATAAGPFVPAAGWYAVLRPVAQRGDSPGRTLFTPVLGWQLIEAEGTDRMAAWVLDSIPVRSDHFENSVQSYRIAGYTTEIPEGAEAWNRV